MSKPVTFTIELDLDSHLARHLGYDEEGEVVQEPTTVEDVVLGLAAQKVVDRLLSGYRGDDPTKELRATVLGKADELAAERVGQHVEAAFDQLIHETNDDGSEVLSHTLRESIVKATKAATQLRVERRDSFSQTDSVLEKLVREEVDRTVEREVKKEIEDAKAKARGEVAKRVSEALAASLAPKTTF